MKLPNAYPKSKQLGGVAEKDRPRKPRQRKPMRKYNAKRAGSSFPKQRDAKYRRWIRMENMCMLAGRHTRLRLTLHDRGCGVAFEHICWGANTPAHVGEHQARGAPDFGVLVPLCQPAHQFYDEHRTEWRRVTGYTEKQMASAASGYALKYVERGGSLAPTHPQEHP